MHPALKKYLEGKINLSPAQEELVSNCFQPITTRRGELLLPQGNIAKDIYFVLQGYLRIFVSDEAGNEATRFLVFEGQMGTAFPSFILQQPSEAGIQSPEPSQLLTLSYQNRQKLHDQVPGWETMDRIAIEKEYVAAIRRIESLITMSSKDRYKILLDQHPGMIRRLPAKTVADWLGISQETLSRLKAKK
jgi:CRP-like cAMP-binding protein